MHRLCAPVGLSRAVVAALPLIGLSAQNAWGFFDCPPVESFCASVDNGGTASLPAVQCPWGSRLGLTMDITNGLAVGDSLASQFRVHGFFDVFEMPGGSLGGNIQQFHCALTLYMDGTGSLAGFHRTLNIPMQCETHSAPRTPGASPQSFDTDMFSLQGQLPGGDPDFDLLRITGGSAFGMPSPGHTTLTRLPNGDWSVDSFFDITYRIDFVGHSPGPLGGHSGSTTGTIRMSNGEHSVNELCPTPTIPPPTGPAVATPANCPIKGGAGTMDIINGLPPGSPIHCIPDLEGIVVATTTGGALGGLHNQGSCQLILVMNGAGTLSSFHKTKVIPIAGPTGLQCDSAPMDLTSAHASYASDLRTLQGQLPPGDRDFDLLRITAGTNFGMPSPGHTTLTRLPGTNWAVDSFFDITYRIDFIGHSPGPLGGMSGSTTGTIRMNQGLPFPQVHMLFDGLDHFTLGQAHCQIVPDPVDPSQQHLVVNNIGSSGQDGVSIDLGGRFGGNVVRGAQGHALEMDWGPGHLPFDDLRISSFFDVFYGDVQPDVHCTLSMMPNGPPPDPQIKFGLSLAGLTPPPAIPQSLDVVLMLHGEVMQTHTYLPPYPPVLALGGFRATPDGGVTIDRRLGADLDGDGMPDILVVSIVNPFDAVCSIPNEPTTTGDEIQLRLNGLPPGTRYIGNRSVAVVGISSPGSLGSLTLRSEHMIHRDLACRGVATRGGGGGGGGGSGGGVRIAGGDVNGDGISDLAIENLGSSGQDGIWLEADIDGDAVPDPITSIALDMHLGEDGTLPPNSSLRMSFFDVFAEPPVWSMARRCDDGTCATTEFSADFSALGATTMRCRLYNGNNLVLDVSGIPNNGPFAVVTGPMDLATCGGAHSSSSAMRCDWSWGHTNPVTVGPGSQGIGNHFVIEPVIPNIPVEIIALELTGVNVCDLDITNRTIVLTPECASDIFPPGTGNGRVDVNDLLAVITHWGLCPAPCPPHCAGDIVHNCRVDVDDLLAVITHWGTCPTGFTDAAAPPPSSRGGGPGKPR